MIPKTQDERLAKEVVWFASAVRLARELIVIARKSGALAEDEMWIMSLFGTLKTLERHLNPKRLRFDDLDRKGVTVSGVLRGQGLRLLLKGLDGVLLTYQLTQMCHDGGTIISSNHDAVAPLNYVRVDETAFEKSPSEHLDTMQEGCELIMQDIGPSLQQIQLANVAAHVANAVAARSSPPAQENLWTDWTLTKIVKGWFKAADIVTSPTGWTTFAKQLRKEGLIENHPVRKARMIRVHHSVFTRHGMQRPDITSK